MPEIQVTASQLPRICRKDRKGAIWERDTTSNQLTVTKNASAIASGSVHALTAMERKDPAQYSCRCNTVEVLYNITVLHCIKWSCSMLFMIVVQEEAARSNRQGSSYDGSCFSFACSKQASLLTMNEYGRHHRYVNQQEQGLFFLFDVLECGCAPEASGVLSLCSFRFLPN